MGETHRKNVIIVGAGASKEFGLPTGFELLDQIASLTNSGHDQSGRFTGDSILYEAIQSVSGISGLDAMRFIRKNIPITPSIDNFLHTHKNRPAVEKVGKLLISRAILNAERGSSLFYDRTKEHEVRFSRVPESHRYISSELQIPAGHSWLGEFFKLLVEERNFSGFLAAINSVTFISFNYDRCIAQYLLHAAKQYFDLDDTGLKRMKDGLKIIHPYGSLGQLFKNNLTQNSFGSDVSSSELINVANGLRTFTEGVSSESESKAMHEAFTSCEIAIFVGFGFIPLNLKLLFDYHEYHVSRVIGTSLGLSDESKNLVADELTRALFLGNPLADVTSEREKVFLSDFTSRELFRYHQNYLRGAYN